MAFDTIVRGGWVLDGSGQPGFFADVGLAGGNIRAIGDLSAESASVAIDADGRFVCPGFIDIHNHSDAGLLLAPEARNIVQQGVTTILVGNCGLSPVPVNEATKDLLHRYISAFIPVAEIDWRSLSDLFQMMEMRGLGCNVGSLIGHGSIRIAVMGFEEREPTERELDEMCALTDEAMVDGAFGLSSGLAYAPGMFANTAEVVALARATAAHGGLYATHIRSDGPLYLQSVREALEIGERAGVPVQVSHLEPHYPNFGMAAEVLGLVDEARSRGQDVTFDVPPYMMGMTTITTILPTWMQEGGISAMIARLGDSRVRERIKAGGPSFINPSECLAMRGEWDKMRVVSSEVHPEINGLDLAEIADRRHQEPYDAVFDLLAEENRQIMIVGEFHSEEDLCRAIQHSACMIESDESVYVAETSTGVPHPRAYGTFPMILRKYVRGETRSDFPMEVGRAILSWEEAVHKMTAKPARKLGLADRGMIQTGMRGDILVLDPQTVTDRATYEQPHQYAQGIDWVLVNGVPVVERGRFHPTLPGMVLRKG